MFCISILVNIYSKRIFRANYLIFTGKSILNMSYEKEQKRFLRLPEEGKAILKIKVTTVSESTRKVKLKEESKILLLDKAMRQKMNLYLNLPENHFLSKKDGVTVRKKCVPLNVKQCTHPIRKLSFASAC